jgi:hypothetical protein
VCQLIAYALGHFPCRKARETDLRHLPMAFMHDHLAQLTAYVIRSASHQAGLPAARASGMRGNER